VLGVFLRGTDYTAKRPKHHPIQPTAKQVIEKAKEIMRTHGYTKVYLVTEDSSILAQFKQAFGENLLYLDCDRFGEDFDPSSYVWEQKVLKEKGEKYKRGLDYITSIVLLTKCDALIGGLASGMTAALVWGGEFSYTYVWNLGLYE